MKKLLMLFPFVCFLIIGNLVVVNTYGNGYGAKLNLQKRSAFFRHVDVTFKTKEGYTVHIVGELTHNWSFTTWTFVGTVNITGNGINITLNVNQSMSLLRITGDGTRATEVVWDTGDATADHILNSEEMVNEFLDFINSEE